MILLVAEAGLYVVCCVMLPLLGAVLAFLFRRWAPWVGMATAGGILFAVAGVVRQVWLRGPQHYAVGGWEARLAPQLYVDGLSALMLAMTALVGLGVTLYALGYFPSHHDAPEAQEPSGGGLFWPLWLFLWMALNALFLAADAFNLYVTLELVALSAVALVAQAGGAAALAAAMRYLFTSLLGSLSYLFGVALLYAAYATVDLASLGRLVTAGPLCWTALATLTVGLLLKSALFPLHFWLPPAHANAPAPVSAALSALVVKGSFYLLLRLWFQTFPGLVTPAAGQLLGGIGACAILWGSVQALRQSRLKLLVAYSTVAQLGYLFLVFPLAEGAQRFAAWSGVLLFALAHAFGKSAMFLSSGVVLKATGHDRLEEIGGSGLTLPLVTFALAAVGIIGLPPSGGFMAKWLLLNAALAGGQWWWILVMAAGTLMAASYVLRVLAAAFRSSAAPAAAPPIPAVMQWTALSLALVAMLLGLFAAPPIELLRQGAPFAGALLSGGEP